LEGFGVAEINKFKIVMIGPIQSKQEGKSKGDIFTSYFELISALVIYEDYVTRNFLNWATGQIRWLP
jgi:hypothetical protein